MSRDAGLARADTDTAMMSDPKVLALARRHRDPIRTAAAIALYDAVRLASWGAGKRLTLEETIPGWWLDPVDELAADLEAVRLIDTEHRIPAHAWLSWYGPAVERRLEARRKAVYGGLVSRGMTPAEANAEADRRIDAERVASGLPSNLEAEPLTLDVGGSTSIHTSPSIPTIQPSIPPAGRRATRPNGFTTIDGLEAERV